MVDIAREPASCIRCGETLAEVLVRLGSTRCHSCSADGSFEDLRAGREARRAVAARASRRARLARLMRLSLRARRR
jgi:hypothetical protein